MMFASRVSAHIVPASRERWAPLEEHGPKLMVVLSVTRSCVENTREVNRSRGCASLLASSLQLIDYLD